MALGLRRRSLFPVLATAFLLRAGLAIVNCYVFQLPDSQGDAVWFELRGWEWASAGWGTILENISMNAWLYSWLISILYAITDRSPLMIQGINVLLGTLAVYLVCRLAGLISGGNRRLAGAAAWVAALFPALALYSAIILREEVMVFFFLLGLLYSLRWWQQPLLRHFLIACLVFGLAGVFHTGILIMIAVLGILALLRWGHTMAANKGTSFLRVTAALGLLAFIGALVLQIGWGLGGFGYLRNGVTSLGQHQINAALGRAAYLTGLTMQSTWDVVWQTPIRVVYFLFAPFPWMVQEGKDIFGFIDALLYTGLALLILRNWRNIWRNSLMRVAVLFLAVGLVVFALGVSNYGTAIRHRAKFAPLMIVVAVVALAAPKQGPGIKAEYRESK
jgi:4-amino-4-deoxy-L-arabinose transferase-like glycosyltransferase